MPRLNISKWLWLALGILMAGGVSARLFLNTDIFWGVFIATFLSFITSVLIEKWLDERQAEKDAGEEAAVRSQTLRILLQEMKHNLETARFLIQYLNDFRSVQSNDFHQKKDAIFSRFSSVSKNSLWGKISQAVSPDELDRILKSYSNCEWLNALLDTTCDYVTGRMRIGSLMEDYKMALDSSIWRIQLQNNLAREIEGLDALIKQLEK